MNVTFIGDETSIKDIETSPQIRQIIFDELIPSIKEAVDKNQEYSSIFEINNSGFIIELVRKDWIVSLKEAIKHFEKNQEFEKCVIIRDLIKSIYEQQGTRQSSASNEQHIGSKDANQKKKEKPSKPK